MPIDYSDLSAVKQALSQDQEAEHDRREKMREINSFLDDPDGQWEPDVFNSLDNKPRYTFDKCNPVVDDIAGEMEQADFAIKVRPAGGDATKETAMVRAGLIRNIENISNAEHVYNASGRNMVATGLDGWEVVQDWADGDNFDQDLMIKKIHNYSDRVWFDCGAENQTMDDANHVFVLQAMGTEEYKRRWPDGSAISVGSDKTSQRNSHIPDKVVVGRIQWKEPRNIEIVRMSNGKVYEVNDDFEKVADDLKDIGITEDRRRTRKGHKIMSRLFDGSEWLNDPQDTVFKSLPVIPAYANFKITENKVIYWGVVEKLMDAQRVYNYAKSREIEEGALAPRRKLLLTRDQAANDLDTIQTMNTNSDPAQLYTHINNQPPPFPVGGAEINPGLQATAQGALRDIETTAGIFGPSRGEDQGIRAGVAIEKLQNKADTSKIKYFTSMAIAICQTGKVINEAMPAVYDTQRQVRILGEDGSEEIQTLNEQTLDADTQTMVTLNDLEAGTYDVVCDVGQPFKNRQQQTVDSMLELARIDPSLLQQGMDIFLQNIDAPGVDLMADRVRQGMVTSGAIPPDQLTDEEQQLVQSLQQQEPPADPALEILAAQQQAEQAEAESRIREREHKMQMQEQTLALKQMDIQLKANSDQFKNELASNNQQWTQAIDKMDQLLTQANAMKTIQESAQGPVIGPGLLDNVKEQSDIVSELQDDVESNLPVPRL